MDQAIVVVFFIVFALDLIKVESFQNAISLNEVTLLNAIPQVFGNSVAKVKPIQTCFYFLGIFQWRVPILRPHHTLSTEQVT